MKFNLLPQPTHVEKGRGYFTATRPVNVLLASSTIQVVQAAHQLAEDLRGAGGPCRMADIPCENNGSCVLLDTTCAGDSESYQINVTADKILIVGDGNPGLFYGIQTLRQLIRQFGLRIPVCTIRDAPVFRNRGYYFDISRGRVPRLETLLELVDTLASLKINQLQLYVEHVFPFRFDSSIARGCDPLTRKEWLTLDRYGRDRYVRLVPSLACFGHMGRVLSLPQYRKLAEVEWPANDWAHARWIQRLRGATINPSLPQSRKLLQQMLADFLPIFSGHSFNLCGDETYDLGKGPNASRVRRHGIGPLYLRHVRFLRHEAARHGKSLMFWGDVMQHHPESIPDIPADCTVLDWGYERHTDFSKVRRFTDAGLQAYVCPATRGYRVVFNEVEEARANIAGYAREGARAGAAGLLTTDWGDMGHFNMPACSLHGMALGAAMAWNPSSDEEQRFDQSFSMQLFNDPDGVAAEVYRKAGSTGIAGWPMMLTTPPGHPFSQAQRTKAARVSEQSSDLIRSCRALGRNNSYARRITDELSLACEALGLNAQYMLLPGSTPGKRKRFSKNITDFIARYAEVWLQANKRSGLPELQRAFARAAKRITQSRSTQAETVTPGDLP